MCRAIRRVEFEAEYPKAFYALSLRSMGKMAARSVAPHGMAVDDSEQSTFAEVSLDPWPIDAADPYICRFQCTEDGPSGKAYTPAEW